MADRAITWNIFGPRDLNPPPMCVGTPRWEDPLRVRPRWASPLFVFSSEACDIKGIFCPQTNLIHFQPLGVDGRRFTGHEVHLLDPEDALRAITHFDGYCQSAGTKPRYHAWCRKLVADRLLAGILRFYWNLHCEAPHAAACFWRLSPLLPELPARPAA